MAVSNKVFDLKLDRTQNLQKNAWSMTRCSDNSVAIAYEKGNCIDIINTVSYQERIEKIPVCYDLVFQEDGSLCVSTGRKEAHIYTPDGYRVSLNRVDQESHYLRLNISSLNEIFIANGEKKVYRYSHTSSTPECIETDKEAAQVSITRSGKIVTSSCILTNPSVVQVYESETNRVLKNIEATDGAVLYAAVDDEDRMYVASVRRTGNVEFSLYDIRGQSVTERDTKRENVIPILDVGVTWCHLVSLTSGMLAFAGGTDVHFIKVSL